MQIRRPVQHIIIMLDSSESFKVFMDSVNESIIELISNLKSSYRYSDKEIYLTLITFSGTPYIVYNFEPIEKIDPTAPLKECKFATDIPAVLDLAVNEIGSKKQQELRDEDTDRHKALYYLFSDMEYNPGAEPDETEESPTYIKRYMDMKEKFNKIAPEIKEMSEKDQHAFVVCLLEKKEDTDKLGYNNALALTTQDYILPIHNGLSFEEKQDKIKRFLNTTISSTIDSDNIHDVLIKEKKYFTGMNIKV